MLPVSDPDFWKARLKVAKDNNRINYSVYLCNPFTWKKIEEAHEKILKENIGPTRKVLDAGCGYGRLAPLYKFYTGVDISPDLLREARRMYPEKEFVEADLNNLPFKDQIFDWAICGSIKAMVANNLGEEAWQKILKELKRVSKKVIILEYGDVSEGDPYQFEIL